MRRCLILLTTGFPFTSGEPYLHAEIPILAAQFTHVFLFAVGLRPGLAPQVQLPENVIVCNGARISPLRARAEDVLHGLPACIAPQLPAQDLREAGRRPSRRVFLGYYLSRVDRLAEEIETCLRDVDFSLYDQVCVYSYWFFATAGVGVRVRDFLRRRGAQNVRLVSRAHSYDLYTYANALSYLPCRTSLLQALDGVYAVSRNGCAYLRDRYPAYREKIHTAYLGTDGGVRTAGSVDGVFRILTCCRTIPLKRLDRLADVLRMLPADSRVEWTHIGDGSALPALRRQCAALQGVHVRFLGALAHEKVLDYYTHNPVDLFVNLSSREGLPVAVMEALSFGIPALVTDVGGCSEMIRQDYNGALLAPSFTSAALYEMLRHCMRTAGAMRENAFQTWQTQFSAGDNYARFVRTLCGE